MKGSDLVDSYEVVELVEREDLSMADLTEACGGEDVDDMQGACTVHLGATLHSG